MNKLKFLLFTFFAISIMVGIYSCAKDVTKNEQHEKSLTEEQIKELKEMLGFEEDFVESRSLLGEASCGNTTEGCFLIGTAVKDTFLIPGTNCYAEATYDLYRCLSPGSAIIVSHVFNNFSAFPIDGMGCDSLLNTWDSLITVGNFDELSDQLDLLNSIASEIVEIKYHSTDFLNVMKIFFVCGEFNTALFSEFSIDNCFQWCVGNKIVDGRPIRDYRRNTCGESCCKRTTSYCWSNAQQMVIPSSPVVVQIGSCEASSSTEDCPRGYNKLGKCEHTCFPDK